MFGEIDRIQTAITKLCSLRQEARTALVYAVDFCQLACDIDWDGNAFISAFRWRLRDNVKDLLLNLPDPISLSKVVAQAVHCDNQLFERWQERWSTLGPYQVDSTTPSWQSSASMPEPMQIDSSRIQKFTQKKKDRHKKEDLCIYCGGPGHQAKNCQKKVLTSKPHKFRYTTTNSKPEIEVEDSENHDTQP